MKFNALFVLTALFVMIIPTAFAQTDNNEVETLSIVPKPPTDLVAISNLPINLSWTASPDPSSHIPVTHYSIERSGDSGSTWYVIATNVDISNAYNHEKAVTIDYVDSDIIIGNEYDYRVKAHNVIGESKPSEIFFIVSTQVKFLAGGLACKPNSPVPSPLAPWQWIHCIGLAISI